LREDVQAANCKAKFTSMREFTNTCTQGYQFITGNL
jgi:hypothetical protein